MSDSKHSPRITVWPNGSWCDASETETFGAHMSDDHHTIDPTNIEAVRRAQKTDGLCIEELVEAGYLDASEIA